MRLPILLLLFAVASCRATGEPASEAAAGATADRRSESTPHEQQAVDGAALYAKYCALCHGPKAEGYAADNAPSLVSRTFQESATDDFLRSAIARGRPGTAMAGYSRLVGGPLDSAAVDALVAFLRIGAPPRVEVNDAVGGNIEAGKVLYYEHCSTCHGSPTQRLSALHLANAFLLNTASPGFLRYAVENGRPGTKMESWAGKLSPSQIDDVVAFIRTMAQPSAVPPAMMPPSGPPPDAVTVPPWGPIVLNAGGEAPTFTLRDNRFASLKEVAQALNDKRRIIIVDARTPSEWVNLHITGALPLPYYDLTLIDKIPNDGTWVIAYCACPHHASGVVFDELVKRGYKHAAVLDEGVFAWQRAGYPVEVKPGIPLPPAPPPLSMINEPLRSEMPPSS